MEAKHTPGPWTVLDNFNDKYGKNIYVHDSLGRAVHYSEPEDEGYKEALSNANLISAAPDMIKLIELVYKSFGGGNVITFSDKDIFEFENVYKKATQ